MDVAQQTKTDYIKCIDCKSNLENKNFLLKKQKSLSIDTMDVAQQTITDNKSNLESKKFLLKKQKPLNIDTMDVAQQTKTDYKSNLENKKFLLKKQKPLSIDTMDVAQQTKESSEKCSRSKPYNIMQEMSRDELCNLAKSKKVKNYCKMKKTDLIKILQDEETNEN